jgi:carbon storage regulator CsrA
MLVLSRKLNEQILFPGFDTAVKVLSFKSGCVRLGIEAPPHVQVAREELLPRKATAAWPEWSQGDRSCKRDLREMNHAVRNQLNCINLGLAVLEEQLHAGSGQEAERTLSIIQKNMQSLGTTLERDKTKLPPGSSSHHRSRALLVEDNANERELLATVLRMADVEVDTAGDGVDALNHLHSGKQPDVVLIDMGLPQCDGATMVREIRRDPHYSKMKIFAVTGRSPAECGVPIGPGGVDRWFQKPLDPAALIHDLDVELHCSFSNS